LLQRFRILVIIPILIISIFTFVNIKDFINLNNYSIRLVKRFYQDSDIEDHSSINNDLASHYKWLDLMGKKQNNIEISEKSVYKDFIHCTKLYANMVRVLYPNDLELASEANYYYPNTKDFLYWVVDSTQTDYELAVMKLNEILDLDPNDSVAWRRLGDNLWRNGDNIAGLQAYLNACEINDRESNGCYYVGYSYKAMGELEKAIYYFWLSYWSPSWEIADQLETELSTQNP